jgi:hypothetical protein
LVELPYIFRTRYIDEPDFTGLRKTEFNSIDTLFIKARYSGEAYCYGFLSDTTRFFTLIYYFPADNYYPVIANYTKNGILLSKDSLVVRGCGSDCGLMDCSITAVINKDLTIYCTDSVKYDFFCDSLGVPIPNTKTILINERHYKLTKDGMIIKGREINKEIKNSP